MHKNLVAIVLLGLIACQTFATDSTDLQTIRDSLNKVAEIVHPYDPAYQLDGDSKFVLLDTVLLHHNLSPFDSTYVVSNPSAVSAVYHAAPGRKIHVHRVVQNTTVTYPVYYVNVSGDVRGKEHNELARELGENERRQQKATDKLLRKFNKREISDSLCSAAADSVWKEYYLTEYKLKDKYHVSTRGYVGAPELVGKIPIDTAAVLRAREAFVQRNLERIIDIREWTAKSEGLCTLQPGNKYVLPDDYVEVINFEPVGADNLVNPQRSEFGLGTVVTILNMTKYYPYCEYRAIIEHPDGSVAGTGYIRGSDRYVSYPYKKQYATSRRKAWIIAISAIKDELSLPVRQTTVFPRFAEISVDSLDDFIFVIDSYFDARDAFGIDKRTMFRSTVQYLGGDDSYFHNWQMLNSRSWQE